MRPSPSMVVALIALFVALSGGAYAATLPARSVGAKQLKRAAVKNVAIANNAITSAKVRRDALTGADINEATLAVASATSAGSANTAATANNATHANAAAGLDRVVYVRQPAGVAPAPPPTPPETSATIVGGGSAVCPAGMLAVAGGVGVDDNTHTSVVDSFPEPGGRAWSARVDNSDSAAGHTFTVVAVCLPAAAAG